ncbi:YajQ family cyclic di-GMP-binding protein [Catenovulum sp. SM1970]|uniref:YajQ family cyclic di-GMP-binding protein n=1 Tax=Marinifaba aquimaris TaxID=2741323 RepID=UPI0015726773|nr:YajQ family cyclic di-GMP-binding protein [Marinifaba aquimaris]NTS75440.1 YajQ family cyclic di-GMP-binding protein [Marinifaba aquimaris]
MPSFDVVSEVNLDEMRNATENSSRELSTRFDFRGVEASFEWKSPAVILTSEGEHSVKQMVDILRKQLVARKIDPQAMDISKAEISGKTCTQKVTIKEGIEKDVAKKIVKLVKDSKIKVQVAIQGEELRVTGKKRDDLQAVMQLIREADLGQPFQFKNFKN